MFIFPEKTKIDQEINLKNLFSLLYKNEEISRDCGYIDNIKISNILNNKTLNVLSKGSFNEIYIIKIKTNHAVFPQNFFNRFDKYVEIPTMYIFQYDKQENYILSIKTKTKKENEVNRIFVSGWGKRKSIKIPDFPNVENIFFFMIESFTNLKFGESETYKQYVRRLVNTSKQDKSVLKGYRASSFAASDVVLVKLGQRDAGAQVLDIMFDFYYDWLIPIPGISKIYKAIKTSLYKKSSLRKYYETKFSIPNDFVITEKIEEDHLRKAMHNAIKPQYGMEKRIIRFSFDFDDLIGNLYAIYASPNGINKLKSPVKRYYLEEN